MVQILLPKQALPEQLRKGNTAQQKRWVVLQSSLLKLNDALMLFHDTSKFQGITVFPNFDVWVAFVNFHLSLQTIENREREIFIIGAVCNFVSWYIYCEVGLELRAFARLCLFSSHLMFWDVCWIPSHFVSRAQMRVDYGICKTSSESIFLFLLFHVIYRFAMCVELLYQLSINCVKFGFLTLHSFSAVISSAS